MSNGNEKEFAEGIYFKRPSDKAPDYVLGNISIQRLKFMKWVAEKEGDYVNLKVMLSRTGKEYVEVDHWKPTNADKPKMEEKTEKKSEGYAVTRWERITDDDIPF